MTTLTQPKPTVPVICPNCMHQGPAFLYLLGRMSRCKICKHDFLMPTIVRMSCPGCLALVRVPAEAVGREVECRFCTCTFAATPDRARARRQRENAPSLDDLFLIQHVQASPHLLDPCWSDPPIVANGGETADPPALLDCPGEHPAFVLPIAVADSAADAVSNIAAPAAAAAEIASPTAPLGAFDPSERIRSLEHALSTLSSDYERLQNQLRHVRTESQENIRQELREIEQVRQQERREMETLRNRLVRLEEHRPNGSIDPGHAVTAALPAYSPTRSTMPSMHARSGNGARTAAAKTGVARKQAGARPVAAHHGHAASPLREIIDRVSSCESITDRLISRLKDVLHEREQDRAAYEQVITSLESELARARGEVELESCFGAESFL